MGSCCRSGYIYDMGDKMHYRVVDSECKYIVEDGW